MDNARHVIKRNGPPFIYVSVLYFKSNDQNPTGDPPFRPPFMVLNDILLRGEHYPSPAFISMLLMWSSYRNWLNTWNHGLTFVHFTAQPKLASEPFCVQFVTSYDPLILLHRTESNLRIPQKAFALS